MQELSPDIRARLGDILADVTVAYENSVAAAEDGLLDFGPVDSLRDAIRELRALIRDEEAAA
jgi:hypothetical protein